jgi:3-mercaptopropionate dioxygenase
MVIRDGEVTELVGRAVQGGVPRDLASVLERLAAEGELNQPGLFPEVSLQRYSRRLIFADPAGAFIILGLTWAPGQMARLHDHSGLWGAELIVSGSMEETAFELKEQAGERFRFERRATREAHAGAAGVVVPPQDYHEFSNPGSVVAHTLHVYSGNLTQCRLFRREEESMWWQADEVNLCYD